MFERDKKLLKSDGRGLHEVLRQIKPSEFKDSQLTKLAPFSWTDFVEHIRAERTGRNRNSRRSSILARFQNYSKLEENPEECSVSSLEFASQHVVMPSVSKSNDDIINTKDEKSGFGDLLGSLSEDPGYLNFLHPQIKDFGQWEGNSHHIQLENTRSNSSSSRDNSPIRSQDWPLPDLIDQSRRSQMVKAQNENHKEFGSYLSYNVIPSSPGSPAMTISPLATASFTFPDPAEMKPGLEAKRREAVWDLFQSESAFLRDHLMALKNVFMEPLKKVQVEGYVMFAEPEVLFGNLDELCCVTYAFCKEFASLLVSQVGSDGELPVMRIMSSVFDPNSASGSGGSTAGVAKAFHRYALNYINALNYLETLRRHQEFCEFEKWCNKDPRCNKLQLTDLLVSPVHHIMKVPLLLKEIEAKTEDPLEKLTINKILKMKESSLRELDDKMKWLKNFERLLEIQRNVVWPGVMELEPKQYYPEFLKTALMKQPCERLIVSPRRQILMEGPLQLLDSGKPTEMFVILFDDMLLITRRKKALSKKKSSITENWPCNMKNNDVSLKYIIYKQPLSLDRFFIHDVNTSEASLTKLENSFILISLNRFQQIIGVHTLQAFSEQIKMTWLMKLQEAQDQWKSTLNQTVFREQLGGQKK